MTSNHEPLAGTPLKAVPAPSRPAKKRRAFSCRGLPKSCSLRYHLSMEQRTATLEAPFFSGAVRNLAAQQVLKELIDLPEGEIARSYYGTRGCMCGCKGTYNDKPKQIRKRLADALKRCDDFDVTELQVSLSKGEEYRSPLTIGGYVYFEWDNDKCACFYYQESKPKPADDEEARREALAQADYEAECERLGL